MKAGEGTGRVWVVSAVVLAALTVVTVTLRFDRLNSVPPGLSFDEAAHGFDALQVMQGEHAVFFPENFGREGMIVYAVALSSSLLGRTVFALRLPTALASVATVFAVFWLAHVLFGQDERGQSTRWRGLAIGSVAAGAMAVSATSVGRLALRAGFLPLLLCLCFGLLWNGWRQRNWWMVGLAGVCAGMLPYTYIAARFAPFLFLLFGLTFLLPLRSFGRERIRSELGLSSLFVGVTGLVAAPILVHFALNPEHFTRRSRTVYIFGPRFAGLDSWGELSENIWRHVSALGFGGDVLLKPWESVFLWIGVGISVWLWKRRPACRLLLLWLCVLMVPGLLSSYPGNVQISSHRILGILPAVYLLVGIGAWETYRLLNRHLFGNVRVVGALAGVTVGILLVVQAVFVHHRYFEYWKNDAELGWWLGLPWMELTEVLNAQSLEPEMAIVIPNSQHRYAFDYLYVGAAPAYLVDPFSRELAGEIGDGMRGKGTTIVKLIFWKGDARWGGDDFGRLRFIFEKYGHYVGSEQHDTFDLHTYRDIFLEHRWSFHEGFDDVTVDYDDGIALKGIALGQGAEQMPSSDVLNLVRGRPLWITMQWMVEEELDVVYALSLRLYDAAGVRVHQEDSMLRNRRNQPTNQWEDESRVGETTSLVTIPAELSAGEYELRMVVYDFETLVPVVEMDVWEAEVSLGRGRVVE